MLTRQDGYKKINRRTCPDCGARSYSSCIESYWDCPVCGKDLSEIPNDQDTWSRLVKMLKDDQIQERAIVCSK